MMLKTHIVFALFISSLFLFFGDSYFSICALFATILPDIDCLGFLVKHRGFMHSLTFAFIAGLLLIPLITFTFVKAFWAGYSMHLFADALTIYGVPLLWPVKKNFKLKLFKTGSFAEEIFFYVLFAGFAVRTFFIVFNYPQ